MKRFSKSTDIANVNIAKLKEAMLNDCRRNKQNLGFHNEIIIIKLVWYLVI